MDINFWNKRYKEAEFAYGTEPNDFLKQNALVLKPNSKTLCLAEGEGRNAVFLASQEHDVTAIDYSEEGIKKLQQSASKNKLNIETHCIDLSNYTIEENKWDTIICIFGHFPESIRRSVFTQLYKGLKSGGVLLMEAYHKDQLNYKTGGPQALELLYSIEDLAIDLNEFKNITFSKVIREIKEGKYHHGESSVIQVKAFK